MSFNDLLKYITPHYRALLIIFTLLIVGSALALLNPWIAGRLTNTLLGQEGAYFSSLQVLLLAWLALLAVKALVAFSSQYMIASTGENVSAKLRSCLYLHFQSLTMKDFQAQRPGDILSLLSNDAEVVSSFVTDTLVQLLPLLLTFIGAFILMAMLDPSIALVAVFLLPIYYIAMKLIGRGLRPISRQWVDSFADMLSFVEENLGLLPAIKAFVREPIEAKKFAKKNTHFLETSKRQIFIESMLSPAIAFLAGMGLLLLIWMASVKLQAGSLNPADLVSLLLYAMLLTQPLSSLADVYGQVQTTRGAAERILEFLSLQPESVSGLTTEPRSLESQIEGRITFAAVSFAYHPNEPVLTQLNLSIASGETLAIVGENGVGKTTLIHLLMRFFELTEGQILLDDIDISEMSLSSLRAQIGLVDQHTLLLNDTVATNIAYSKVLAKQDEIEQAARSANAHDFICKLPDGYDTIIGEQGLRLSGGQRQRLSLARTLLKNPPILILDEATSMFDPEGEVGFIEESRDLLSKKTVILITHRPASLALADRVMCLKDGVFLPQ